MSQRRIFLWVAVGGAIMLAIAAALVRTGAPLDPAGPDGTLGIRRLLQSQGIEVRKAARPPAPPATFLLLLDLRTERQDRDLLAWVERGGRLIVADPSSVLVRVLGISPSRFGALFGDQSLEPGCVAPEALGVRHIEADPRDQVLAGGPPGAVPCFPHEPGMYEVSLARGRGIVILLGGHSFLVNRRLAEGDDALYAVQLLGSSGPVVFGPPVAPGSQAGRPTTIWGALPDGARAAIVALAVALVAFAASRGRRLGRPVAEELVSPIPASELVHATADLYRRAGAVAFSADQLRRGFAGRVGRKVGAPPGAPAAALVEPLHQTTGRPTELLERLLVENPPSTDDGLIALARDLETLARQVAGEEETAGTGASVGAAAGGVPRM